MDMRIVNAEDYESGYPHRGVVRVGHRAASWLRRSDRCHVTAGAAAHYNQFVLIVYQSMSFLILSSAFWRRAETVIRSRRLAPISRLTANFTVASTLGFPDSV